MTVVEIELLLSRVVDRSASLDDWHELERRAQTEPQLWARLAELLHDDAALAVALHDQLATAVTRSELPKAAALLPELSSREAERLPGVSPRPAQAPAGTRRTAAPWWAFGGWAAALYVAVAWWSSPATVRPASRTQLVEQLPHPTALPSLASGSAAGGGECVGELPHVLLETRSLPGGESYEVLYLSRRVERQVVAGALLVGCDDLGEPSPVPVDLGRWLPQESL